MNAPVGPQRDPLDNSPVRLERATAERMAASTRYVERIVRTQAAPQRRDMRTWESAGAWGFLAAGATISAASGATLGTGTVTLCSRDGADLTADGIEVDVYNAAGSVSGGTSGVYVKLGWTDGDWSLDVAPCPTS